MYRQLSTDSLYPKVNVQPVRRLKDLAVADQVAEARTVLLHFRVAQHITIVYALDMSHEKPSIDRHLAPKLRPSL